MNAPMVQMNHAIKWGAATRLLHSPSQMFYSFIFFIKCRTHTEYPHDYIYLIFHNAVFQLNLRLGGGSKLS